MTYNMAAAASTVSQSVAIL